jgi:hypothetical protein
MDPNLASRRNRIAETARYERKFHALDLAPRQVLTVVHNSCAHFREIFPPRTVNNVYFDTPGLSDYWKNVHGSAQRSKLRLRWYGEAARVIPKPVLEIKARHGLVGTKSSHRLDDLPVERLDDARGLTSALRAACADPGVVERLANVAPSIFNRYDRRYYGSADGRFRVTIDTKLVFEEAVGRRFGIRRTFAEDRLIVVELKYSVESDAETHRTFRDWPFRLGRMSKYVYGLKRLKGMDVELL